MGRRFLTDRSFWRSFAAVEPPPCWRVMCSHRFAPQGELNDTDYLCDGGRSFAFRGRFRDFASRADRATIGRHVRRVRQHHAGVLLSSRLLPSPLSWLLLASRLPALLVVCCRRGPSASIGAVPIAFGAALLFSGRESRRYFASHSGTRLSASFRATGLVPPCALPDGSTVLTRPVRSLIGELARSNSWCAPG
jgi:hypothetical protein